MFDQVIESMRKATEATVKIQQEMFKKWISLWPGFAVGQVGCGEQAQQLQKKWAEVVTELVKRQQEAAEVQFKAGLETIEKTFQIGEVKDPEELRAKTIELWKHCFESLRQVSETQVREFQVAGQKWYDFVSKLAA